MPTVADSSVHHPREAPECAIERFVHRSLPWLLSLLAAVGTVSPAFALNPRLLSDTDLADRAQVIVIGRATARQTVSIGPDLATLVTVAVTESLKGTAGPTLTVALPGGIDRRRKIPIEVAHVGAPRIATGEEVLLFLERGDRLGPGVYVLSGRAQGKLSIVVDPAGVKWVSRDATPVAGDPPAAGQPVRPLKRLSDVRDEIGRRPQDGAR
jgi:hypothetical protein